MPTRMPRQLELQPRAERPVAAAAAGLGCRPRIGEPFDAGVAHHARPARDAPRSAERHAFAGAGADVGRARAHARHRRFRADVVEAEIVVANGDVAARREAPPRRQRSRRGRRPTGRSSRSTPCSCRSSRTRSASTVNCHRPGLHSTSPPIRVRRPCTYTFSKNRYPDGSRPSRPFSGSLSTDAQPAFARVDRDDEIARRLPFEAAGAGQSGAPARSVVVAGEQRRRRSRTGARDRRAACRRGRAAPRAIRPSPARSRKSSCRADVP